MPKASIGSIGLGPLARRWSQTGGLTPAVRRMLLWPAVRLDAQAELKIRRGHFDLAAHGASACLFPGRHHVHLAVDVLADELHEGIRHSVGSSRTHCLPSCRTTIRG